MKRINLNGIKIKDLRRQVLICLWIYFLILWLIGLLVPIPEQTYYSKEIRWREGGLLSAYLSKDDKWRFETDISELSPELIKAVLYKEDKLFYYHFGFNPYSVGKAIFENMSNSAKHRGASTITMQLARMMDRSERNYWNKLIEMLRAVKLEIFHSKEELLEQYFSLLPYGGNIEGVKAASYLYFGREPKKLSLSQVVVLTIIPNNPNWLRPDNFSTRLISERNFWLSKFKDANLFSSSVINDALNEPVFAERRQLEPKAAHFSNYIAANYSQNRVISTLSMNFQMIAERLLAEHVAKSNALGVTNGAVLIVDNRNSEVLAYCGSVDYNNKQVSGQVNGVRALRSPGSTLKPLLTAYCFDLGIITPKSRIPDIPTEFAGYAPENYSMEFKGNVTIEYALRNSLNIPFVRLMKDVGADNFMNQLSKTGFKDIGKRKKYLGLSLILGGCGATLEQLTTNYSILARKGKLHKLKFITNESYDEGIEIYSEASCFMVSDILVQQTGQDFPKALQYVDNLPEICWKTGTSFGKRDAWAIGYNANYTIGVWMGNFDGKGSAHLSGSEMAVPLLFELFGAIGSEANKSNSNGTNSASDTWFTKPQNLAERYVCSESGLVAVSDCKEIIRDYYINDVSHNIRCNLYRDFRISLDGRYHYCNDCLGDDYLIKKFLIYDIELALWLKSNNNEIEEPPPHNPDCRKRFIGEGPRIISPSAAYVYMIEKDSPQEIMLLAAVSPDVTRIFWYNGNEFIGSCNAGEKIFFSAKSGQSTISCLDDKGRKSTVIIQVKYF